MEPKASDLFEDKSSIIKTVEGVEVQPPKPPIIEYAENAVVFLWEVTWAPYSNTSAPSPAIWTVIVFTALMLVGLLVRNTDLERYNKEVGR